MTTERDFDRIARAWLGIGPNEAPDRAIEAVLGAIETTQQAPRPWRWTFRRPRTMSRLPIFAVIAALILVVGAAYLGGGGPFPDTSRSVDRSPAVASPSPSTAIPSPSATRPTASAALPAMAFPEALRGSWTGTLRPVDGVRQGPASQLLFAPTGSDIAAMDIDDVSGAASQLQSRVVATDSDVVTMESTLANAGCAVGDRGNYSWSVDGTWLRIRPIDDECLARSTILRGPWLRSLADDGTGGAGYGTLFRPFFSAEIPAGTWDGQGSVNADLLVTDTTDGTSSFRVWKDPDGFVDPCLELKGRVDLAPGIDPFVTYLKQDRAFTVKDTTETTVDGHRAVLVTFTTSDQVKAPCHDGAVLEWQSHAAMEGAWHLPFGETNTVAVTEVAGATLVIEPFADGVFSQGMLDSMHFLDQLPSPPAS